MNEARYTFWPVTTLEAEEWHWFWLCTPYVMIFTASSRYRNRTNGHMNITPE